jgi:CheY-like chemotaxis protein
MVKAHSVPLPLRPPREPHSSTAPPRVLIADGSPRVRDALRRLLADEGMEVAFEAGDGPSAVAAARRVRPDVALVDVRLPGLDGLSVARRITAWTEVVICTALAGPAVEEQAVRAGAVAVVAKGSHPLLLVGAVWRALSHGPDPAAGLPRAAGKEAVPRPA